MPGWAMTLSAWACSVRRLQTIMHHNALDLVTMAELVTHLLSERP